MQNSPKRSYAKYLMGGTGMAMLVAFAAPVAVQAQEAAASDDVMEVVVVGARAAQQSSNQRKKNAKTPTDSIVADDVGAFPDKNLNEAISRIAGVALGRDDFGEGDNITIRGNSAEQIRVEMDGLGVGNGAGFAMGNDGARGSSLTSLPSDLIKSVDVVKGATADMTEGSLGGSVRVQTRTGLDFAKPYISLRVAARRNSLGEKWTPDYNFVASRKFFDNRLGVIVSVTGTKLQNNTNAQSVSNNTAGYMGRIDFDDSPEKTFSFNPATVSGDLQSTDPRYNPDLVWANSNFTTRQIVEMSAAAQSKDDCYAAFPIITPGTGPGQSNTTGVRNQRVWELQTCLNQWNDLEPTLVRSFDSTQNEDRFSADIRFDYRVNDRLTVYAKYMTNSRKMDRQYRWRSLSGGHEFGINPGNEYNATNNPAGVWLINTASTPYRTREIAPGADGYYYYDGVNAVGNQAVIGNVIGIDPSTVKVDSNHYVTEYVMNDAWSNITQSWEPNETTSNYLQFGGTYTDENLKIEFIAGRQESDFWRHNMSTSRSFNYGSARFFVQPSGLWSHEFLGEYDETNPANYVAMNPQAAKTAVTNETINNPFIPAYTVAERPLVSTSFNLNYDAWMSETAETTAKFDVTYNFNENVPFITLVKAGLSYRNPEGKAWRTPNGGELVSASGTYGQPGYVAPVVLPSGRVRSSFRACEPTATSIEPCNYGYYAHTALVDNRGGVYTLTPDEMVNLIATTSMSPDSNFFNDYEGAERMTNWQGIDVRKLVSLTVPNFNLDCVKSCVANDGNVYEQPYFGYDEKVTAAYYMVEFEQELPLNLVFNGNVGLRAVETEVTGSGQMVLQSIRTVDGVFDPLNPNTAGGTTTTTFRRNVEITRTSRDYLPSYNLNLWLIPSELVVRYYKSKTVSRPSVANLLPGGTCTVDERRDLGVIGYEDPEDVCSGRVGNPALKPYTAWNQSVSLEWYPNRDTMLSLTAHQLDVLIDRPRGISETSKLFAGTDYVDPVTGEALANVDFTYPTWGNGPGFERKGWEFTSKTAFSFLPWYLRYTGADFNYSKLENSTTVSVLDPNTGDLMPPAGESSYFANLSLWYDDGKTNARVSWQARDEYFRDIEGNSGNARNNYPFEGGVNSRPVVFNPGNPYYQDKTLYVDAKITHKVTPSVELYLEARNLTKEANTVFAKRGNVFEDGTPYIHSLTYGGRHFSVGFTYRQR